jgi:RimJ/RimL family protein N-acetyltransferase
MIPHLADTPVLETERLTLRAFGPQDVERAASFLTSSRSVYMGGPYSQADAWEHCCHFIGHWAVRGYGLFSICLKGSDAAIGEVGPFRPISWPEPEIAWGLWDAEHEGAGYAFEAAQAARLFAYRQLGWSTAISYVDRENAPSIALAERMGCVLDGSAPLPDLPDWEGTLVYRHPAPADLGLTAPTKEGVQ